MSHSTKSIASDVGLLAAAVVMPGTLQKSMIDRDASDQGIATGLTMALAFSIAVLMQDGIEAISNQFIDEESPVQSRKMGLVASSAAVLFGIGVQAVLAQKDTERLERSIARTLGFWLTVAGAAGVTLRSLGYAFNSDASIKRGTKQQLQSSLFIFPLGVLLALAFDFLRYRRVVSIKDNPIISSPGKAFATGFIIVSALTVVSRTEKFLARNMQKIVDTHARPLSKGWLPIGHVASTTILFGAIYYGMSKLYRKIESSQDTIESQFHIMPNTPFTSGSIESYVKWESLSLQGRRHIGTRIPKDQINIEMLLNLSVFMWA